MLQGNLRVANFLDKKTIYIFISDISISSFSSSLYHTRRNEKIPSLLKMPDTEVVLGFIEARKYVCLSFHTCPSLPPFGIALKSNMVRRKTMVTQGILVLTTVAMSTSCQNEAPTMALHSQPPSL